MHVYRELERGQIHEERCMEQKRKLCKNQCGDLQITIQKAVQCESYVDGMHSFVEEVCGEHRCMKKEIFKKNFKEELK